MSDQINKLYTNVASIPSFSAKIAEFLRKNETHSLHRRIVKKKYVQSQTIKIQMQE